MEIDFLLVLFFLQLVASVDMASDGRRSGFAYASSLKNIRDDLFESRFAPVPCSCREFAASPRVDVRYAADKMIGLCFWSPSAYRPSGKGRQPHIFWCGSGGGIRARQAVVRIDCICDGLDKFVACCLREEVPAFCRFLGSLECICLLRLWRIRHSSSPVGPGMIRHAPPRYQRVRAHQTNTFERWVLIRYVEAFR